MATKMFKFYGEAKWAKVHQPDEKYKNYEVNLYMDEPSWDLFAKSGLQLKRREDETGKFVVLRRASEKIIKGELKKMGPPKVVDGVGRPIEDLVGNGSKIAVEVAVYDTAKGPGHRMEKVIVLELVEYGGKMQDAHAGVDRDDEDAPAPVQAKKSNIDDAIPF